MFGKYGILARLFVKVPQPGDSEGTFSVFELTATCYYYLSNHSKVEALRQSH